MGGFTGGNEQASDEACEWLPVHPEDPAGGGAGVIPGPLPVPSRMDYLVLVHVNLYLMPFLMPLFLPECSCV